MHVYARTTHGVSDWRSLGVKAHTSSHLPLAAKPAWTTLTQHNVRRIESLSSQDDQARRRKCKCIEIPWTSNRAAFPIRGRAGCTMILYDFPPTYFVKNVLLKQLYYFQYNRAVWTTPYAKLHVSWTKTGNPLPSILEESLCWPKYFSNYE